MSLGVKSAPRQIEPAERLALLRRFLEAYWLRPENALWMTLRSMALSRRPLDSPSADISCGDGVFSFLHCGGQFDPDFDVFSAVGKLERVRNGHADMFDCADDAYRPTILAPPSDRIDVGTDLKPAMIAKAGRLNLYGQLVEHDNNSTLPFDDDSFATVYCNSAYWVKDVDSFLMELARVTRSGGQVIVQVKLDAMRRYSFESHRALLGDRWLELIDRGRSACWPALCDRATWEDRFHRAGLVVQEAFPFVTKTHAHLWDIGLRPIAPMLVKMTRELSPQTRAEIKADWVDLFVELLDPLCNPKFDLFSQADEAAEIQYVLTPR